ncbi:MAG TPA: hypothetical protein VHY84_08575 [Bryobacteraceae bacterium]|nr:hypothetical protein [Bryobacteraceae bacterium]
MSGSDHNSHDTAKTFGFRKWVWSRSNRGVFQWIASRQSPPVTADYVRKVFWEQRQSVTIRRALRRAGAPMGTVGGRQFGEQQ